jgi:deoxyribonuclease-4
MAIRIGVAGYPSVCKGLDESFEWLAKKGLHEEIEFVRNVWMTAEAAKHARELKESYGLELSVHAPYYINLCNPEKLAASKKRILDSCDRAEIMGADVVVFHPGFYGKLSPEEAYERVRKACDDMAKKTSVTLGLETTGKKKAFGTLDENIEISQDVGGCAPVVDFAHIYARNGGSIDYAGVLGKVKKFKHLHSHFSGIAHTDAGEKHHLPVMSKKPDFSKLVRELKKRKLDIMIICESPYLERDALLMKRIVEK